MYKVTLSMPIYNVAPYVERALLSALNQTFESIEFLLVDDRGTDNSMDIVRRIIKDHPRGKDVRIIEHPHNIGLGATRNTAIDNAQGEYLFFMDSDDEITPDCIQVLYDKMMEEKVDFVVGSIIEVSVSGEQIRRIFNDITSVGRMCLAEYVYMEKHTFPVMTWNKLYDLSFIKNNDIYCYPKHLNEDMIFNLKVVHCANSFSIVSIPTIFYYRRVISITGVKVITDRTANQYIDILVEYKKIYLSCKSLDIGLFMKLSMLRFSVVYIVLILNSNRISKENKRTYYNIIVAVIEDLSCSDLLFCIARFKSLASYLYYKLPFRLKYMLRGCFDFF